MAQEDAVDLAWVDLKGAAAGVSLNQVEKDLIIQTNAQNKNKVKGTSWAPYIRQ
jgi:hypothetical protein